MEGIGVNITVRVDRDMCQGHAQCVEAAAEVFDIRDDGFAYVLQTIETPKLLERVKDAMSRCPENAITIDE